MMQERYLAQLVDGKGSVKDFFRFSCKNVETVRKNILSMAGADNTGLASLIRKNWAKMGIKKCLVFERSSGVYSEETVFQFEVNIEDDNTNDGQKG